MEKNFIINTLLIIILYLGKIYIDNYNYYFITIYLFLFIYHLYVLYLLIKYQITNILKILLFLFLSYPLYYYTYNYICDTNPTNWFISYRFFCHNFVKAIAIVFLHTFYLFIFLIRRKPIIIINFTLEEIPLRINNNNNNNNEKEDEKYHYNYFFLCDIVYYFLKHKIIFVIFSILFCFMIKLEMYLFLNRDKLWVYINSKERTLPIASSKNTTFYITATIVNMESTINNYIEQMKKLINYLGEQNTIISIVENGDSTDKTRFYLIDFKNYLNEKKVLNKFILEHEIDDPRKKVNPYVALSNLRIKYYSMLRNKCLEFLYEIPNIDFNNTKVIFFNDIFFQYEDIINLLSTNNEDYDAVCGLDFGDIFYDTWVSIDLDGNSLLTGFPFFTNREAQELVLNHKPIRVFSCWNGVIAFNASPLENKKVKFRYRKNPEKERQYKINNSQDFNYESECTYFHIDLYSLGYTKKFINPEVRVAYTSGYYYRKKYEYPSSMEINSYKELYERSFYEKRNKFMSNYKDRNIKLDEILENWYLENKIKDL